MQKNISHHLLVLASLLAICIIAFVHIFLFPLYEVQPRHALIKFYVDYEQSLCITNLQHAALVPPAPLKKQLLRAYALQNTRMIMCPRDAIVTVAQGGRLGNQIWEYAAVWAVSRRTGLEPYVPRCIRRRLDQVFENLSIPTLQTIGHCPVTWQFFARSLDEWNYINQSILLPRYTIQPEIVLQWVQDIRKEFTFQRTLIEHARAVLDDLTKLFVRQNHIHSDQITRINYVGVHVRRTDYKAYLSRTRNIQPASRTYYLRAMHYFEQKYKTVVFVVVSDDPIWCVDHLAKRRSNVFVASKVAAIASSASAGQDLAVMAACNHTVIDYGTFGVWGAILAGGETVVYNISHHSSIRVSELLPHWHVME